jgi:transposase, IS6 family
VTKQGHDRYRAVDAQGETRDVLLRTSRDAEAAERFFRKGLEASQTASPRVIPVDQNAA